MYIYIYIQKCINNVIYVYIIMCMYIYTYPMFPHTPQSSKGALPRVCVAKRFLCVFHCQNDDKVVTILIQNGDPNAPNVGELMNT